MQYREIGTLGLQRKLGRGREVIISNRTQEASFICFFFSRLWTEYGTSAYSVIWELCRELEAGCCGDAGVWKMGDVSVQVRGMLWCSWEREWQEVDLLWRVGDVLGQTVSTWALPSLSLCSLPNMLTVALSSAATEHTHTHTHPQNLTDKLKYGLFASNEVSSAWAFYLPFSNKMVHKTHLFL